MYASPHATHDCVIHDPIFTVIVGIANNAYKKGTEKSPICITTPRVAAPQPTSVIGPLKRPINKSTANTIQRTSSFFGNTPPSTTLKYGAAYDAT